MSIILKFRYLIPLVFLPLILVFIWFNNGLIIGKGEEGLIFYNPSKNLELSKLSWIEVNTGMPNLSWLPRLPILYLDSFLVSKLGLAQYIIQAGLFFLLMVTGAVSIYYLTLSFLESYQRKNLISLLSALFYLMNPFSTSQVWGRGVYPQYFAFALLPLSLLILIKGLKQRSYLYLMLLIFPAVVYSWAFGFATSIIIYWLILGGYFIWWLVTSKLNQKEIFSGLSFMFLFFLGWFLVSAWWFLPLLLTGNKILVSYLTNTNENLGTLLGVSRSYSLDVIVRLIHKGYFFDASAYSPIYSTLPFQLISFIPLFFVIIGIVKILRSQELVKFRFFVVLLILGLVVSLGANPPLGWLFVWIFEHIALLQAFRNPFEKFGLVYILGYAPLFAIGLATLSNKGRIAVFWIISIMFLIFGIYAWPMWTGRVLAGMDKKIGVKVPEYYEDLNIWLKSNDSQNYRLFMTPLLSGEGSVFEWGDTTYNGVDPMHFILDRAAISNGARIPFYYDFAQGIRKYMPRENLAPALSLLRAKFLIDRKDAIMITDSEKDQIKQLTSTIYPPTSGTESNLKKICQNQSADSRANGLAWIICRISPEDSNLTGVRYLHLEVKTDVPAKLEVTLRDSKETRIRWDGRADSEYITNGNDWNFITLPLDAPTENDSSIDLSKITVLEVLAHSKDYPEKSAGEIDISEIKLDPGVQKQIDEFRKVGEFGKLSVFEPIYFNPPPEFGNITSVNFVEGFPQLFKEINKKRDFTDKEGFVLTSQNNQKNLVDLEDKTYLQTTDKYKISDTRYWLRFNQGQGTGLLILSKTFNPQWKVITGVSKEKLSGNFFDDLNLLKAVVLPEDNHYVVNGYANLWKIENDPNQLAIVFLPQIYAEVGLKISVVSISVLILVSGALSLRKVLR